MFKGKERDRPGKEDNAVQVCKPRERLLDGSCLREGLQNLKPWLKPQPSVGGDGLSYALASCRVL